MMSPFYMMWDPTYILIVIGMGISLAKDLPMFKVPIVNTLIFTVPKA